MNKTLQIPIWKKPPSIFRQALIFLALLFVFQSSAYANLPDFILTITKTDETCLANGTLTFTVQNTDPSATVEYKVYRLPDTVNAIAIQTTNFLSGQTNGTYRVIATQTLNGVSNSQTQDISIINAIIPLVYTISSTHAVCGNDGSMTVTITSGTGSLYEIISGPVVMPPQSSPLFNFIPAGIYGVRVFDNCGQGWVTTHTLVSDAVQINIAPVEFPDKELPDCNTITVSNTLTPSANDILTYPIITVCTVFPPDGSPAITFNQTITSGQPDSQEVKTLIPFYYDQPYFYNLIVTDHCGNVFTLNNNLVHQKLSVSISPEPAVCGQYFITVRASTYKAPIIIHFLTVPSGFVPANFNAVHPGPFTSGAVSYGSYQVPVPFGTYAVEISDGCGHTAQGSTTLIDQDAVPAATIEPYAGCLSNTSLVKIEIPGFTIVSAQITVAPSAYPNPVPDEVSAFITADDGLVLEHLITGNYTVHLIDDCGNLYDYDFFVPDTATSVALTTRNDCEPGKAAIRIRGNSTALTSAIITSAPAVFPASLPYDVSFNLTSPDGIFSMNNFPPGTYIFKVMDSCGLEHDVTTTVAGYSVTGNDFTLTPHCGSFDINLEHISNGAGGETFWLQKYNTATASWGHPGTNVPYTAGTAPNASNSYAIANNTAILNLTFTGTFRIIKSFGSFENGSVGQYKDCIENIRDFEFTGQFEITGFEKLTCNGAFSDIKVLTNGVPPMTYKIIQKNGQPFLIDNGTNNIFTNLETAIYTFEVQHSCGHIATRPIDVTLLPSLVNANQPGNLVSCDDISNDGAESFSLTSQNAAVLGTQSPSDYTLTYHLSLSDATLGINPLPDNYISENQTIYCRLKYNASSNCFDVTSFEVIVNPYPVLEMKKKWALCEGNNVTIIADSGFSYLWSTGESTSSITVSQPGIYTLQVTQTYATGSCMGQYDIEVVPSAPAVIHQIEVSDWTENDNTITVILDQSGIGNYTYSLDNVNFQPENTFYGLAPGSYTVYVKDEYECGTVDGEVFLLTYPKYFTPNGDGFHDFWKVEFSETEPHLKTYIFDRYGKLITGFLPDSPGWNGTLNGEPLPSTDYWFLVVRENGKTFRGHFAMKR